ncbi:MAG: transposase [Ignavibacteria bacterium]|nr:transposase [Ignavibacteria bacterium]
MEKEKRSMRYNEAFKREAVALVLDRRLPVAKAAQQEGVNIDTLNKWIAAAGVRETEKSEQTFEARNKELERENRALKMERDIGLVQSICAAYIYSPN